MTLDETIKTEEKIAEENQRIVDTGIVFDDVTLDVLYCDDTEVIEEHLANYQRCAEEHRQIAEWLKELKRRREAPVRLKEQISILRSKIKSLSKEYEKGFMSALSATEAMIATLEQEENND